MWPQPFSLHGISRIRGHLKQSQTTVGIGAPNGGLQNTQPLGRQPFSSQSQWHLNPVPPMHLHLIPPMHLHLVPPMHMYSPLTCQSLRYQSWMLGTLSPNSIPSIGVGVSTRTSLNGWESLNSRTSTKAKLSRAALFSILMSKVSGSQHFGFVKTTYGSTTIAAVIARRTDSSTVSRNDDLRPLPL